MKSNFLQDVWFGRDAVISTPTTSKNIDKIVDL
jgi:hypothetical protein